MAGQRWITLCSKRKQEQQKETQGHNALHSLLCESLIESCKVLPDTLLAQCAAALFKGINDREAEAVSALKGPYTFSKLIDDLCVHPESYFAEIQKSAACKYSAEDLYPSLQDAEKLHLAAERPITVAHTFMLLLQ